MDKQADSRLMGTTGLFLTKRAETARYRWFLNHRFSVANQRPLTATQVSVYFLLGIYYLAYDQLNPKPVFSERLLPPSRNVSVSPNEVADVPQILMTSGSNGIAGAGKTTSQDKSIAKKVFTVFESNQGISFTEAMVTGAYNSLYSGQITSGQMQRLTKESLKQSLQILINEKRIRRTVDGGMKYYNQAVLIQEANRRISDQLEGVDNLHETIGLAAEEMKKLFENADIYLVNGETGEVVIVSGDRNFSKYQAWQKVEKGSIFDALLKGKGQLVYFANIRKKASNEGPIFTADVARYNERYSNPEEVIFSGEPIEGNAHDGLIVKINEWRYKDSKDNHRPLYSKNIDVKKHKVVNAAIRELFVTLSAKIEEIKTANQGKTLKEIWEDEEKAIKAETKETGSTSDVPARPKVSEIEEPEGTSATELPEPGRKLRILPEGDRRSRIHAFNSGGKAFIYEQIVCPGELTGEARKEVETALDFVAIKAWGQIPTRWRERFLGKEEGDEILIVRNEEGVPISVYAIKERVEDKEVSIEYAATVPEQQGNRISTAIVTAQMKKTFYHALVEHIVKKNGRWGWFFFPLNMLAAYLYVALGWEWCLPKDLKTVKAYMGLNTPNPVVWGIFSQWLTPESLFPHPDQGTNTPTSEVIEVARHMVPEGCTFDERTFVMSGDYRDMQALIRKPEDVPVWKKSPKINKLFQKNVKPGEDQVMVISWNLKTARHQQLKQRELAKDKRIKNVSDRMSGLTM